MAEFKKRRSSLNSKNYSSALITLDKIPKEQLINTDSSILKTTPRKKGGKSSSILKSTDMVKNNETNKSFSKIMRLESISLNSTPIKNITLIEKNCIENLNGVDNKSENKQSIIEKQDLVEKDNGDKNYKNISLDVKNKNSGFIDKKTLNFSKNLTFRIEESKYLDEKNKKTENVDGHENNDIFSKKRKVETIVDDAKEGLATFFSNDMFGVKNDFFNLENTSGMINKNIDTNFYDISFNDLEMKISEKNTNDGNFENEKVFDSNKNNFDDIYSKIVVNDNNFNKNKIGVIESVDKNVKLKHDDFLRYDNEEGNIVKDNKSLKENAKNIISNDKKDSNVFIDEINNHNDKIQDFFEKNHIKNDGLEEQINGISKTEKNIEEFENKENFIMNRESCSKNEKKETENDDLFKQESNFRQKKEETFDFLNTIDNNEMETIFKNDKECILEKKNYEKGIIENNYILNSILPNTKLNISENIYQKNNSKKFFDSFFTNQKEIESLFDQNKNEMEFFNNEEIKNMVDSYIQKKEISITTFNFDQISERVFNVCDFLNIEKIVPKDIHELNCLLEDIYNKIKNHGEKNISIKNEKEKKIENECDHKKFKTNVTKSINFIVDRPEKTNKKIELIDNSVIPENNNTDKSFIRIKNEEIKNILTDKTKNEEQAYKIETYLRSENQRLSHNLRLKEKIIEALYEEIIEHKKIYNELIDRKPIDETIEKANCLVKNMKNEFESVIESKNLEMKKMGSENAKLVYKLRDLELVLENLNEKLLRKI